MYVITLVVPLWYAVVPRIPELALYAHVNSAGQLELVNHLGVNLGSTPEEILTRLEKQQYQAVDILDDSESRHQIIAMRNDVTFRSMKIRLLVLMQIRHDCLKHQVRQVKSVCLLYALIPMKK